MPPAPLAALSDAGAPGLSIVVPVYRGAATIGLLVDALSRLRPEGGMEVVLVNDGSPDNSAEICRALVRTAACRWCISSTPATTANTTRS